MTFREFVKRHLRKLRRGRVGRSGKPIADGNGALKLDTIKAAAAALSVAPSQGMDLCSLRVLLIIACAHTHIIATESTELHPERATTRPAATASRQSLAVVTGPPRRSEAIAAINAANLKQLVAPNRSSPDPTLSRQLHNLEHLQSEHDKLNLPFSSRSGTRESLESTAEIATVNIPKGSADIEGCLRASPTGSDTWEDIAPQSLWSQAYNRLDKNLVERYQALLLDEFSPTSMCQNAWPCISAANLGYSTNLTGLGHAYELYTRPELQLGERDTIWPRADGRDRRSTRHPYITPSSFQ
jgi:hypothetical protein